MTVLILIHFFVTLALIGVILMQRSEGGGLGMGGANSSGSFFSARGAANLLTRTTAILATIFIVNCLVMTIVTKRQVSANQSLLKDSDAPATSVQSPASDAKTPVPVEQEPKAVTKSEQKKAA